MVAGRGVVAVPRGGTKEKIGFVVTGKNGYQVELATHATTSHNSTRDSASAVKPKDAVAVIHGHIDGQSDGVVSPADAAPVAHGLPNGVVSTGRVGVTEINNGRLQFRMLKGRMTSHESTYLQRSLDKQQRQPEFMEPEDK